LAHAPPAPRGLPLAAFLILIFLVGLPYLAKRTPFGRHVYAVGGNAEAARRAGINVHRIRILVFMISGAMAGVGGIILAANVNSVDLNVGGGTLLLNAIAAAVIGGVRPFGGGGGGRGAPPAAAPVTEGLERAQHRRLLERDDLRRHRRHPPARGHARHRRAPPAGPLGALGASAHVAPRLAPGVAADAHSQLPPGSDVGSRLRSGMERSA